MVNALQPRNAKTAFVKFYDGDLHAAAYLAGTTVEQCKHWLRDEKVRQRLRERGSKDFRLYRDIATRDDRKMMLSWVMGDDQFEILTRIRALEILGRIEGDFIERRQITGADGGPLQTINLSIGAEMPVNELEERVKKLQERSGAVLVGDLAEDILG